ncbi:MAG: hypothetical protein K0S08_762 [Gammaproteobacteria bacterium]|jgi:lysophospholipase L1-like esterase|nr:hypothetical protein [Gammaproteobacteria bacterium]
MKNILCYGDSNTWGYIPGTFELEGMYHERYSYELRWTGRLQKLLGNNYRIIDEGLNGRTTDIDDNPNIPGTSGETYLLPCLNSHVPLDLVILMLGCNDLKSFYHRSAQDIAAALGKLIRTIQSIKLGKDMRSPPEVLLLGYPTITREDGFDHFGIEGLFKDGIKKSEQFDCYFSKVAAQYGCHYLNIAPHVKLSKIDGIHLDAEGHKTLANLLAKEIKKIYSGNEDAY